MRRASHNNSRPPAMASPSIIHDNSTTRNEATFDSGISTLRDTSSPTSKHLTPRARPGWKTGAVNYLDGLRALPEIRSIPWMPGKELPPHKSTESPRTQTKSAFLMSTRGRINDPPCTHCSTGVGRFLHCITLDGWFHGACATCQMGTRGNLCSLRVEGVDKSKTLTDPLETTPQQRNEIPPSSELKSPIMSNPKRKRESLRDDLQPNMMAMGSVPSPYSSPYTRVPNLPVHQPQNASYSASNIVSNYDYNDPTMINYIYKRPVLPNGAVEPQIPPQLSVKGGNLTWIQPAPSNSKAHFHNHQQPLPTEGYLAQNRTLLNPDVDSDESSPLSPSEQLLGSTQHHPGRSNLRENDLRPPAIVPSLVDCLPKKKQKLIHGLFKHLQDGIKKTREQTDAMQKQLDQLQAALGMNSQVDVAD